MPDGIQQYVKLENRLFLLAWLNNLLGNLFSFYEQQRIFREQAEHLRPYNPEKPIWVFVGSTVNAVYSENKEKRSAVLTVARFLRFV